FVLSHPYIAASPQFPGMLQSPTTPLAVRGKRRPYRLTGVGAEPLVSSIASIGNPTIRNPSCAHWLSPPSPVLPPPSSPLPRRRLRRRRSPPGRRQKSTKWGRASTDCCLSRSGVVS